MKHYQSEFGVGRAYFLDGHAELITDLTIDDTESTIVFDTESYYHRYPDRYICIRRIDHMIDSTLSSSGYFQIAKTSFYKYEPGNLITETYITGEILFDHSLVWVPAPIKRIELYEGMMAEYEIGGG